MLALSLILTLMFLTLLLVKNYSKSKFAVIETDIVPTVDVINPNFIIYNNNKKITIKAAKGNFINKDLILLEENVYFESSDFKIFSDAVIFNKKEETANSKTKSKFESQGTTIISEGFQITNKGDVILFNGETSLILN